MKTVFSKTLIDKRVEELANEISDVYRNETLICICVLKGAVLFFSDLVRRIKDTDLRMEFLLLSSYRGAMEPGEMKVCWTFAGELRGKHVLIVEDVVDTGHSMRFLMDEVCRCEPLSVRLAALVDKRERREVDVRVDFGGFVLDDGFIVGYGLDHAERWRTLPEIYVLEEGDKI